MELEEKLFLLDNIIDYLYYNFKTLRRKQNNEQTRTKSELKKTALKPKLTVEQHLAFKLLRKGINPSLSLDFQKITPIIMIGGQPLREIQR